MVQNRPKEAGPSRAVSPNRQPPASRSLCLFRCWGSCTRIYVIQDYEELGVFCNEACGDKRFRLYLNDTADEDGRLD